MQNKPNPGTYIVAGCRPWNRQVFDESIVCQPGSWHFIATKDELTLETVQRIDPEYIFFLHWSWFVPEEIYKNYQCVCFHMTDVPYGRGGSPLQNLIIKGHAHTKLTALQMTEQIDAGPVYMKEELSLEGKAEEIYLRATRLAAGMMMRIINENWTPVPQYGKPVIFRRRKPEESEIPASASLGNIYDHIRMLDADEYPKAFIEHQGYKFKFQHASLKNGKIDAKVTITPMESHTN